MTAAIPPATDARSGVGPPDGALVRLSVGTQDWTSLPPAPAGTDITVSFSCAAAAEFAPTLTALGYRCVGLSPISASCQPVADFVVRQAIIDEHRQWWRTMADHAELIFALAFGPAQVALHAVLRAHRQTVR